MSARVRAIVARAGGSLPEHLVRQELSTTFGSWYAADAVHYALYDGAVFRVYRDGEDALEIPDDQGQVGA